MIAIIGGGPTGLAAAHELAQRGHTDWVLLEADNWGGLSGSFRDPASYVWDHGGHVVFSHYQEFDKILGSLFREEELMEHDRSSYVWVKDTWIPYPFQANVHMLPEPWRTWAINEQLDSEGWNGSGNFRSYFEAEMGRTTSKLFMEPYNEKVWTVPPSELGTNWLGERVASIDKDALRARVASGEPDIRWGPNNTFLYPAVGGTGEIWRRLAGTLPTENVKKNHHVTRIDAYNKVLYARMGGTNSFLTVPYDQLITTMPLDDLILTCNVMHGVHRPDGLRYNKVLVVGVGTRIPIENDSSWLYFPEATQPFYRATNFSKYSPLNAPNGKGSWMCEIGFPQHTVTRDVDVLQQATLTVTGLEQAGLLDPRDVEHLHTHWIHKAYPLPVIPRDGVLNILQPALENTHEIYSRGRFGAWKYEYGNQDHSVVWGLDVVRKILDGEEERQVAWRSAG